MFSFSYKYINLSLFTSFLTFLLLILWLCCAIVRSDLKNEVRDNHDKIMGKAMKIKYKIMLKIKIKTRFAAFQMCIGFYSLQ